MAEPKLRFTQNNGEKYPDLVHLSMGDIYTERNERGDPSLPVLTVSIHSGVSDGELDEDELGKRVKRSSDLSQYKKAVTGDLVFNMMRAWQGAVGCVKTTGVTSPAYIVAKPNEKIYPPYMDYYVQTKNTIDKFNRLSYGALDFRKRLYWDSFITADINIPVIEEQKKIADFLTMIDEVIATSEAEVTNLESQKKAIMKKIFRQEVRFTRPNGSAFPIWEECRFGDTVIIERGGSPRPIEQYITEGNGLNWIKISDAPQFGNYITKTAQKIIPEGLRKTRQVFIGDLILSNSMSFGKPYIMGIDGCIHDGWLLIRNNQEKYNLLYLCYLLGSEYMLKQYKSLAGGSAVNNLNKELVAGTTVFIPILEEQRMIADFLSDFDDAIAAARRELELWKQLKKALLQQLFV